MRGTLRRKCPFAWNKDNSISLAGRGECISERLPRYPDFGITRLGLGK